MINVETKTEDNVGPESQILPDNSPSSTNRFAAGARSSSGGHTTSPLWILEDQRNIARIEIPLWKKKTDEANGRFIVYVIRVEMKSGYHWTVERRFREFFEFHTALVAIIPGLNEFTFPTKKWFFNFSEFNLLFRKTSFEHYLNYLLKIDPIPPELNGFLEISKEVKRRSQRVSNRLTTKSPVQTNGTNDDTSHSGSNTRRQVRARTTLGSQFPTGSLPATRPNHIASAFKSSGKDSGSSLIYSSKGFMRQHTASNASTGELSTVIADDDDDVVDESGLTINDFQLIKVIGQGSFGKVFLVKLVDGPKDEIFAMKVLKKCEVEKKNQILHTMTERQVLAEVRHPFIISLRAAFHTSDRLYMVTDYCKGGELFYHLKLMKRFPEDLVQFYCIEACLALSHLNNHSIIYRDMKPENILLDSDGHIRLTDFGLAKILPTPDAIVRRGTFCGTPEYLAPEMILHRHRGSGYGCDIDWWSLGIVCFEMLTGWPPFIDKAFDKLCDKILKKPLRFPARISVGLSCQSAVRGFLERDPSRRLGCTSRRNLDDIKAHMFFRNVNFDDMLAKRIEPPFRPSVGFRSDDTRNVDAEFTSMPVSDTPLAEGALNPNIERNFDNFGFMSETLISPRLSDLIDVKAAMRGIQSSSFSVPSAGIYSSDGFVNSNHNHNAHSSIVCDCDYHRNLRQDESADGQNVDLSSDNILDFHIRSNITQPDDDDEVDSTATVS